MLSKFPGKKDIFKELRVKLLIYANITISESFFVSNIGNAKLSTTTARERNRALGPQVYRRYPNPGKHRKSISTIPFARSAKFGRHGGGR